jgi:DNA-directed RNA polymerase subunit RPC12/RpoP
MGKYQCKNCGCEFVLGEPSQEELKPDSIVKCPKCKGETELKEKVKA